MDRHELAWAAGFFDGDGWAAAVRQRRRRTRQPAARINQAGDGVPETLIRFRAALGGLGSLGGPHQAPGRRDLYWWSASSRSDVETAFRLLGPWLGDAKTEQFRLALGLSPGNRSPLIRDVTEDGAWAAGFFDAEGTVSLTRHRTHVGYFS